MFFGLFILWGDSVFFSFVINMNTGCLSKFNVLSSNVRGIRDQIKRRSIFSYLKDQKANIYFLQETYSERADENIWRNEWGGALFFSHGTTHSKGVCILINPFAQPKVDYYYANDSGRIVLTTITLNVTMVSKCRNVVVGLWATRIL